MPDFGTAAMGLVSGGTSLIGGMMGSDAAEDAADAQIKASEMATAEQRRQFDLSREDLAPWRNAGTASINYLARILNIPGYVNAPGSAAPRLEDFVKSTPYTPTVGYGGNAPPPLFGSEGQNPVEINPSLAMYVPAGKQYGKDGYLSQDDNFNIFWVDAPGGGTQTIGADGKPQYDTEAYNNALSEYNAKQPLDLTRMLRKTPGYKFMRDEGNRAIGKSAAARGGLLSGGTLKALKQYSQGLADQTYENYLNRIASVAGVGQSAVNTGVAAGANAANNISNNYLASGNARASGYINQANAITGALNSGVSNLFMMNALKGMGGGGSYGGGGGGSYNALSAYYNSPNLASW